MTSTGRRWDDPYLAIKCAGDLGIKRRCSPAAARISLAFGNPSKSAKKDGELQDNKLAFPLRGFEQMYSSTAIDCWL